MATKWLTSKNVALIAIFAAVQAILAVLPFTLSIGVSGQITLGVIGGPLIGILLGPFVGGIAVLIGSFIGVFLNPPGAIFGVLTIFPPFLGAVGAGCVKLRKGYISGAIMTASLLGFYAHPVGREAYLYPWLHVVAIIVAFSPIALMAGSTFNSSNVTKVGLGIPIAAFVGVLADHIFGSALGIWYFTYIVPSDWNVAATWNFLIFVYPAERIVALVLISLIAIPLYYRLKSSRLVN